MPRHALAHHYGTHPHPRDVTLAWVGVVLFPVAVALAMALGEGALDALGYPTGSSEQAPLGYALLVGLPALALAIAPGVAAYVYGSRARLEGHDGGAVPAFIGGFLAAAFFTVTLTGLIVGR